MPINLSSQLSVSNTLGEGVIWDHRTATLLWTDILQNTLYSWQFGEQIKQFTCHEPLGCFGLTPDTNRLICAFKSGFAFFIPETGELNWIQKVETELSHTRFNDGRVDRQGRFWAGTIMDDEGADKTLEKAALYRLDNNKATKVIPQVRVSNGLCWSPSGDTLYFADSPTQTIKQASMNTSTGDIQPLEAFVSTDEHAFPDGACVDNEGAIWSAQWGSRTVKRYSPEGELLLTLNVPCQQPSCVAFGGPNMQHLFVTSARVGLPRSLLDDEPENGNIFIYETPYIGIAESVCTFTSSDAS